MNDWAFYDRVCHLLGNGQTFALARILDTRGSTPQDSRARMLVFPGGQIEFTLGGGVFEAAVRGDALALLENPQYSDRPQTYLLKTYKLNPETAGMYCRGEATVLVEVVRPLLSLVIFGAGHVAQALCRFGALTNLFAVMVVDDRPDFLAQIARSSSPCILSNISPEVRPENTHPLPSASGYLSTPVKTFLTDPEYIQSLPAIDERTFVVVVTRCHDVDKKIIRRLLSSPAAYLGLIGSHSKWEQFKREWKEEGMTPETLERIHCPIGLPIGGKSPEEVAVSILAELIQVKNQVLLC